MRGYGLFLLGFQGATCFKYYKSTGATGFWKEDNSNQTNPNNYFWHQPLVVPEAKMSCCVYWGNEAVDKSGKFKIAHLFLTGHIFYSSLLQIASSGPAWQDRNRTCEPQLVACEPRLAVHVVSFICFKPSCWFSPASSLDVQPPIASRLGPLLPKNKL